MSTIVQRIAVTTVLLLCLCSLRAAAQSNAIAYDDGLVAGWDDWSWSCSRDFNNASPKYGGATSIALTYTSAWSALSLHHEVLAITNWHYLEFYIHGGTNRAMDIQVYVTFSNTDFAAVRVTNYLTGGTLTSSWKRARIPIVDFNCTSQMFTRIHWKETAGHAWGAVYLDSITLVNSNTPVGDTNTVQDFAITSGADYVNGSCTIAFDGQTCAYYQVWTATTLVNGVWTEAGMMLGTAALQVWTNHSTADTTFVKFSGLLQTQSWDADNDGLNDVFELKNEPLDPLSPFSDADGMPDGWEFGYSLSPTNATGNDGDAGDPDGDGRSNLAEYNSALRPDYSERYEAPLYLDYGTGPWYHDGNGGGWTDPSGTDYVRYNRHALRVGLPNNSALGILRVSGSNYMDTTGYTHLEFWINGGVTNGQKPYLAVRLEENTWPGGVSLADYVTVQSNSWTQVQIPLTHLGAAGVSNLSWIFFKNTNATAMPVFWLDNVKLVKPWPPADAVIAANVSAPVSRTISRRMFGMNTCTWDNLLTNTVSRDRLMEAGITMLRFPGGSAADTYDWQKNTNKTSASWYGVNTSNFLALADALGAEKNITVNYGSGSAAEASNWVTYVFSTLNRTCEWWCVGNECFASWEYDTNSPAHDPVKFAQRWRQYRTAMTNARPGIKVGVPFTYGEDDYTNLTTSATNPVDSSVHRGWSPVLLHELSNSPPDFVEIHFYGYSEGAVLETPPERANDVHLMRSFRRERDAVNKARKLLCDYLGGVSGSNVAIHITENNSFGYNIGKQMLSLVNGMHAINEFGQACLADADALLWWDVHNGIETNYNLSTTLYGWRNYGDYGILASSTTFGDALNEPYPVFYAFKMLTNFARAGDHLVQVTNSYPDILQTYACVPSDTGSVRLLVMNTSLESALRPTISLAGFTVGSNVTVCSYGMENDSNRQDIAVTSTNVDPAEIRYTFPKYSMTVLKF